MAQLAVFIRGIDMECSIIEELAALLSVEGTTTGANLYEVGISQIQKLAGMATDGMPNIFGRNCGVFGLSPKT
jgi:hypothetical protein